MERRRRNRRRGPWSRKGLTVSVALVAAVLAVLWLTILGPGHGGSGSVGAAASTPTAAGSAFATIPPSASPPPPASASASASASAGASASASRKASSAPAAAKTAVPAGYRQITVVNAVNQTIWAATNQNAQHPIPVTGWKLAPGQSVTFTVPPGWGGRVWGRTGCTFDSAGKGHCATGDCGGVLDCRGSGATPATLAELTLDSFDGMDFYDVSLVDGSNLPMYINTTHRVDADPVSPAGCYQGTCTTAINCPAAMQVKAGGQAVACETACAAFGTDDYCCRGAWSGRENCLPAKWPVDYAKLVFKDAEPYAYSYAYDDSATMACKGGCNYRITFGITP
jgi:hypothetical protein